MSRTTKKKYVVEEVLNKYDLPADNQRIVKVLRSCGNNLHEITTPEGETFLVSMPTKFRKHIWIKRGDFVVIDPITEGVKVKGEIAQILLKDQIKYFKDQGIWPEAFAENNSTKNERRHSTNSDDELFVNTNRPYVEFSSSSEEEEDEEN
ncbi:probable RNA-binding protein EIF1AD [Stegodyphus dumicola]|uniref:probable RNA-binding protein EIF1AD n=1 Tax=Stegodyphus dumicola TaxID=202533 RepID=UPI0015A84765|nr:probable RNA-binding protein EIF1AD [Stegodyphus dumicola]XP_035225251.1 probable RNA-binding protein EIF1AD [Stegodyphus dumicola]